MKIQFDPDQPFQRAAIDTVTMNELYDGDNVAGAVRDGTGAWLRRRRRERGAVEGT